ncbi:phosphatidylserine decarboxylase family protein [Candidatus Woesearchaeota archaeon]|nr:phosphatidylserine decarboxylase family protein [Candidatus Woesearchaeota archaeon]
MLLIIFKIIIVLIILFYGFYRFVFLRDPKRRIPKQGIISPADGKIVKILKTGNNITVNKGLIGKINTITKDVAKTCHIIVIMMNIHNVHVQRSPIKGTIKQIKYSKGKFLNAVFGASSLKALENEKNEIIIENKNLKIKIIQVAGFVARRIKCYVKQNQKINKGERIGMIDLGSQVILVLPEKVKILVHEGEIVKAGMTIIANE